MHASPTSHYSASASDSGGEDSAASAPAQSHGANKISPWQSRRDEQRAAEQERRTVGTTRRLTSAAEMGGYDENPDNITQNLDLTLSSGKDNDPGVKRAAYARSGAGMNMHGSGRGRASPITKPLAPTLDFGRERDRGVQPRQSQIFRSHKQYSP